MTAPALDWLPPAASAHAPGFDRLLLLNLIVAAALLLLVHLLAVPALLRAREPQAEARSRSKLPLEYLPLAALTVLFAWLTVRSERMWAATRTTGPDPGALHVEATGMQFAWYFRYPGKDARFGTTRPTLVAAGEGNPLGIDPADQAGADDIVASELVLPAGTPIDLRLHAQDVIHGFAVPALRIKQNAVPGQDLHLHFTATEPGSYAILCTQLCGLGHYRMSATLRVVPRADYAAWLAAHEPAR